MIGRATEADIPRLLEIGKQFHAKSPYSTYNYDEKAISNVFRYLMGNHGGVVMASATGAIGGLLVPVFFDPSKWLMEISFWYVPGEGAELLTEFERVSRETGATGIHISTFVDGREELSARFLRRLGYKAVERRYIKDL